jgi:hypothetical protein
MFVNFIMYSLPRVNLFVSYAASLGMFREGVEENSTSRRPAQSRIASANADERLCALP